MSNNPDEASSARTDGPRETELPPSDAEVLNAAKFPGENPNPVLRIGRDGLLLYANQASRGLLSAQGMAVGRQVPVDWGTLVAKVLEEGSPESMTLPLEGGYLYFSIVPVREAGYVNLYGADITDRVRAERAEQEARLAAERNSARVMELQKITAQLVKPLSKAQIVQIIVDEGIRALGARAGSVALLDSTGTELEVAGYKGYPEELIARWRRFPLSSAAPLAEAVRTGEPVWIESRDPFVENYTDLASERVSAHTTFVSVPLVGDRVVIGGVGLSFDEARALSEEDRAFILTLARQCSLALERARLFQEKERLNQELEQRVKERTTQLEEAVAQLHRLAAYLQSAREEERADIARDLHDDLGQFMTALRVELGIWAQDLQSQAGESRAVQATLARIQGLSALVDQTAESLRRVLRQLRPGVLEDVGLVRASKQYLDDFSSHTKIVTRFQSNLAQVNLSPDAALALFRILQEACNNAAKHAQASRVVVSLTEESGVYVLSIQDNGRGIRPDEKEKAGHFGLLGIRERVLALNGTVAITGAAGQGTLVCVRVPFTPTSPARAV